MRRKACARPGCANVHTNRGSYCDEHQRPTIESRPNAFERGYDRKWRNARARFLRNHPVCECDECRERIDPLPADTVDHIVPHKGDEIVFWDRTNWRAMNFRCHSRKTALHDGGFGR